MGSGVSTVDDRCTAAPAWLCSIVARELLFRLALMHPEIAIVWADSAYAKNGLIPWAKKYLDITIKTVRNHVSNIFGKLQVADRAAAIVKARDAGYGDAARRV